MELLLKIVLGVSILGMILIVFRKVPVLVELPQTQGAKLLEKEKILGFLGSFSQKSGEKIMKVGKLKNFFKKKKKVKIEESEETSFSDDYWEKIRKS